MVGESHSYKFSSGLHRLMVRLASAHVCEGLLSLVWEVQPKSVRPEKSTRKKGSFAGFVPPIFSLTGKLIYPAVVATAAAAANSFVDIGTNVSRLLMWAEDQGLFRYPASFAEQLLGSQPLWCENGMARLL